tara:strand:- start:322 stop:1209 length:888 start_codon:yes stop_codon:yes gene_type:complete
MKIYIKRHNSHAGRWIYKGYKSAWEKLGYETEYYNSLSEIRPNDRHQIMALDSDIKNEDIFNLNLADRVYVYAQPNKFPEPWGSHPNFVSNCPDHVITQLNEMDNVRLWSFTEIEDYHYKWKKVHTVHLAYDDINYQPLEDERYKFDVCFIGGWANNGFNEKRQIMIDHFKPLLKTDLKCGIFINKAISHDVENKILYNSKLAVNVHDAYQRVLGLDTSERTFKSLGLTGVLVSDKISVLEKLLPQVPLAESPEEMSQLVQELAKKDLTSLKEENRQLILENHTYSNRVKELLEL